MKLLVRADDLGYSEAINFGIAKTVTQGIVKNVGVMVNMPATEHGLNLLKDSEVCYGCHTNICVGKPLTNAEIIPSITTPEGYFKPSKDYRNAKEDFVVLEEVILEIEAQYRRFVSLTGRQPQYFEGHAISSPNFVKGLEIVANKYGLKFSGFPLEGEAMKVNNTLVYTTMESMEDDYQPFDSLKRIVENHHADGIEMMILHPGYLDDFIINTSSLTIPRTKEVEMATNPETLIWLNKHNVELITYDLL